MTNRIEVGTHVTGSYMGSTFTGTVRSHRQHTINYRVFITQVELDAPVHIAVIDRTESEGLMIATSWNGTPVPSDAGDWGDTGDYLEVIA